MTQTAIAVPDADPSLTAVQVTDADRFLFDLQGFILLRGALSPRDREEMLEALTMLEAGEQDDSGWRNPNPVGPGGGPGAVSQPTRQASPGSLRLNGLLRLSTAFDRLIDYPTVFPYLQAFMTDPQIGNTWSITKTGGAEVGGWHRGCGPDAYSVRNGVIRTRMFNTVFFLTDNGPEDGCMAAIPGGHKSNFDLPWRDFPGLALPGSIPIVGNAGDVLIFSESLLHTGLGNTTGRRRTNLYFNYVSRDFNIMTYSPQHNYHFAMPPHVRQRFTPARKLAAAWMEHVRTID